MTPINPVPELANAVVFNTTKTLGQTATNVAVATRTVAQHAVNLLLLTIEKFIADDEARSAYLRAGLLYTYHRISGFTNNNRALLSYLGNIGIIVVSLRMVNGMLVEREKSRIKRLKQEEAPGRKFPKNQVFRITYNEYKISAV